MAQERKKRDHDETSCQPPEGPLLCANNCGFFGSAATMNFCSKCYKDMVSKQAKANGSSSSSSVEHSNDNIAKPAEVSKPASHLSNQAELEGLPGSSNGETGQAEGQGSTKQGPIRCNCCKKRVGLTGFNCRCGNTFCSLHRYTDKHNCPFDYRAAGRAAIEKANPVVKAEKVDKL